MQNQEINPQARTVIVFSLAVAALMMLILATQVEMPTRAILVAVAFSDIIFLLLILLGKVLPDKRR